MPVRLRVECQVVSKPKPILPSRHLLRHVHSTLNVLQCSTSSTRHMSRWKMGFMLTSFDNCTWLISHRTLTWCQCYRLHICSDCHWTIVHSICLRMKTKRSSDKSVTKTHFTTLTHNAITRPWTLVRLAEEMSRVAHVQCARRLGSECSWWMQTRLFQHSYVRSR